MRPQNLLYAQSGGMTAVINATACAVIETARRHPARIGKVLAARNGILLVSHYRHLEKEEGHAFSLATVLQGSEERLVPILMTAATAALALLPLVLKGDVPGNEIERPMALVILGGLVTSTLLNLILLPALYARFGKGRRA